MNSNSIAKSGCVNCLKKIHLIFYAPGRDKNTFHHASLILKKDYDRHYPDDITKIIDFSDGEDLVEKINTQDKNSIISLDIVSHGNQAGIHISKKLLPPELSYFTKRNAHMKIRGKSEKEAEYMEEYMIGLYSGKTGAIGISYYYNQKLFKDESTWGRLKGKIDGSNMNDGIALLNEIKSNRFTSNAFIEFHGCRVAEYQSILNDFKDNFAEDFAEYIGKNCTVVGHIENNFPDKHPENPNDYRHNKVRIYGKTAWYRLGDAKESDPIERWGLQLKNSSTPPQK